MEVKEKSRKRELIKSIAIVFLVVLLLLTFFSNTIMNRSLPEVATQSISSGTINARIRGTGTVTPNESYEVVIDQTREVRSVCVQVGDTVQQGDLLFVLGDMESAELQSAQEQLDSLNLQYQQKLLNLSREYATEDRTVRVLREDLNKAVALRDENLVSAEELAYAKNDLAMAKSELDGIERTLEELQAYMNDEDAYTDAQAEVAEWSAAVDAAETAVESYEQQLEDLDFGGDIDNSRAIDDAEEELAEANYVWRSAWMAYAEDYAALYQLVFGTALTVDETNPKEIDRELQVQIDAYLRKSGAVDEGLKTAYTAIIEAQEDVISKRQILDRLEEDAADLSGSAKDKRRELQRKLDDAEEKLSDAQRNLRDAEAALEVAENNHVAVKQQIKTYESFKREYAARVGTLTETLTGLEEKKAAYEQAVELVAETERAIEDALAGKNIDKQLDDLDLQALRTQIEKAQELVDKYTAKSVDTEIKANVSGLITEILVSAGKETTAGAAMAVIDLVDRGYMIRIPVTNEQSRQVKVGDSANVTNYYWGESVEATLEAIIPDPGNPGAGKLLVFRVTGDIDAGANITLSIGQRSANYDTIIPKSALREDTNGYFVLVITVKSSPLSNRYIATRVNVNVLAEDDTSAAVSGLSAGDFVITTSSKPVTAGTQVRMVENP